METKRAPRVDKFTFEYISTVDTAGKFGKFIYRNIYTNKLVSSHESPFTDTAAAAAAVANQRLVARKDMFTPDDIGLTTGTAEYLPF